MTSTNGKPSHIRGEKSRTMLMRYQFEEATRSTGRVSLNSVDGLSQQ